MIPGFVLFYSALVGGTALLSLAVFSAPASKTHFSAPPQTLPFANNAPCKVLPPTRGAEVHWPNRWPEMNVNFASNEPPSPRLKGDNVSAVWRLEVCETPVDGPARKGDDFFLDLSPLGRGGYCGGGSGALACDGRFVLTRLVGCPANAKWPNGTATLPVTGGVSNATRADTWALGPDELVFTLEGPEVLVLEGVHVGNCVYEFVYSVTVPGTYRAFVIASRADWDAISDEPSFPALTLDRPVGNELFIKLGNNAASEAAARAAILNANAGDFGMPACVSASPPGRWVLREQPPGGLFSRTPSLPECAEPWYCTNRTAYFVSHLHDLVFMPYRCRWPTDALSVDTARTCLQGVNINWRGDSQMRVLYNDFLARAMRVPRAAVKGVVSPHCVDGLTAESIELHGAVGMIAPFFACLSEDPLLDSPDLLSHNPKEVHPFTVVINAGQHFAAQHRTTHHLSFEGYERKLRAYANGLADALATRAADSPAAFRGVVWVETSPHPIRNDKYVWEFKDGRTLHRLALFNRIAERELRAMAAHVIAPGTAAAREPLRFVRAWTVLLPMIDVFPDQSHAEGTPALTPIAHGLFHLLCSGDRSAGDGFSTGHLESDADFLRGFRAGGLD